MIRSAKELHRLVDGCMQVDQHRFRRKIRELGKRDEPLADTDTRVATLLADVTQSAERRKTRESELPSLIYPDNLPVVAAREQIVETIRNHSVSIICGETGSGKTTQLPKMCLEAGLGRGGFIGHTQPRRIAARSVAARIASEMNSTVGEAVGYKIRFSDQVSENSYIKLMTDGILLAEIQRDPWLNQYDAIIVDEAHERSLNIDFLLGFLKQLLKKRRDLKLVITSATIDPDRFSKHFYDAPIITAEGRSYPVEVRWSPLAGEESDSEQPLADAVVDACETLLAEHQHDVLVFLSGEREIREVNDVLGKAAPHHRHLRQAEILPLYSRLSNAEQNRIFDKHQKPRIILSTNVAETSLTVPGIRAVVDAGFARISRYSIRSKVQRLPIEKIARASADQRKGRCGREAPGICIRLYDEDDFAARPLYTEPEILRTNLAAVILQMTSMRLGAVEDFPFIDPPESRYINDGYRTLQEIGALNDRRRMTPLGKKLARLPIDPRLGRMLLAAVDEGCVSELLTIVSALSVQDPRDRPHEKRQSADELHAEFNHEKSDFLAWLNLWAFAGVQRDALSNSRFRKMCKQRFLSYNRLREWQDVRRQLTQMLQEMKVRINDTEAEADNIHRALLTGLLSNIAVKTDKQDYLGTRNRHMRIFPGSSLHQRGPKWLMAAEISETSRLYARQVAAIDVAWIEPLARHLLQRSHRDPHWSRKAGVVSAWEQTTLYGLIINPKNRVNYAPINPVMSREIFIRDALVAGAINTRGTFLRHNLALLDEVRTQEEKSRRRDIVVDPEELVRFYDALLPEDIHNTVAFESWRKTFEKDNPRGLYFSRDLLVRDEADEVSGTDFPEQFELAGVVLPLRYHFAPGDPRDGVTLVIPIEVLNRVSSAQCEWLVPGLREEKMTALIKSLPKSLRRNFVPAPDFARAALGALTQDERSLRDALASELQRMTGVAVTAEDFDHSVLEQHLIMRYELLGPDGKVLDSGRDLTLIQKQHADGVEQSLLNLQDDFFEQQQITDWNFGDLPLSMEMEVKNRPGVSMRGFPALCETDEGIVLKLFATQAKAEREMAHGLRALYRKVLREEVRYLKRKLPNIDVLSLRFAPIAGKQVLVDDIINAAIDAVFIAGGEYPRTREAFHKRVSDGKSQLVPTATRLCADLEQLLEHYRQLSRRIDKATSLSWVEPVTDLRDQVSRLLYPGFVSATGAERLPRLVAYFSAMQRRLDAVDKAPDKDRRRRAEFLPVWERFNKLPAERDEPADYHARYTQLRWSFEELRISLFAQEIGTREKVSVSRLEQRLAALE